MQSQEQLNLLASLAARWVWPGFSPQNIKDVFGEKSQDQIQEKANKDLPL